MSLLSHNLKAFMAIVQMGSVHGAAGIIHLTQTAVTQRIRTLEKKLGITLFLRSRRGMRLTQEGEALLRYCNGAEDLEGEALSHMSGAAKDRPISIAITGPTSVMTARISELCAHLYSKFPNLYLNFIITDLDDRLGMIRSGQASLAIISPEKVPNEMDSKLIKPDKYILVASAKWKGRRLNNILTSERVIDFNEDDKTTLAYLKHFKLISHLKKSRLFVNGNEAIIKYFIAGIGFGTLTQEIAQPYLDAGKLITLHSGTVMEDPLALVWYPRPEMPSYFRAIINSIK